MPDINVTIEEEEINVSITEVVENIDITEESFRVIGRSTSQAIGYVVKYTQITASTYTVVSADLILGLNIFGITFAGDSTITVPASIDNRSVLSFKYEVDLGNTITIVTA